MTTMLNRRSLNPLALYKPVDYGPRYFPRSPILYYSRKPINDELLYDHPATHPRGTAVKLAPLSLSRHIRIPLCRAATSTSSLAVRCLRIRASVCTRRDRLITNLCLFPGSCSKTTILKRKPFLSPYFLPLSTLFLSQP